MTLAELLSITPLERWRGLPVEQQERIGAKVLEQVFADLVAEDDGTDTSEADRDIATAISQNATGEIGNVVQDAFPQVGWHWPDGTRYLVFDKRGHVVGEIESATPKKLSSLQAYRFVPLSPYRRSGPVVDGLPAKCLPPWINRLIAQGGRWAAVLPTAHQTTAL